MAAARAAAVRPAANLLSAAATTTERRVVRAWAWARTWSLALQSGGQARGRWAAARAGAAQACLRLRHRPHSPRAHPVNAVACMVTVVGR